MPNIRGKTAKPRANAAAPDASADAPSPSRRTPPARAEQRTKRRASHAKAAAPAAAKSAKISPKPKWVKRVVGAGADGKAAPFANRPKPDALDRVGQRGAAKPPEAAAETRLDPPAG